MEERITNRNFYPELEFCINCKYYGEPNGCNRIEGSCDNYDIFVESYNKLKELEDGFEDGTIVKPPCKVGDTLYEVFDDKYSSKPAFIQETIIDKIVITSKGLKLKLSRNSFYETAISSLGKTLFLSKEKAKKKLEELNK